MGEERTNSAARAIHRSACLSDKSCHLARKVSLEEENQDTSPSPKTSSITTSTNMLALPHGGRIVGTNESTPIIRDSSQATRNYNSTTSTDSDGAHVSGSGSERSSSTRQSNNSTILPANRLEAPRRRTTRNGHDSNNLNRDNSDNVDGVDDDESRHSWFKRITEKYGTLELDNKGSVARDHLALERTFLAWLRTSLAFASIGIAITQLFRLNTALSTKNATAQDSDIRPPNLVDSSMSLLDLFLYNAADLSGTDNSAKRLGSVGKPLGATFIGIAVLILVVGFHRYFESQYWIVRGKFPASRGSVALVTFVAAALIVASLVVVLVLGADTIET